MDKKYFQVNFDGSCKAISRQTYLKRYESVEAGDNDIILWYDDGNNVFIGDAALNDGNVVITILNTIGNVNIEYCMWGI